MSVLFINTMTDSFTPTNSYSTATWVWELCRVAQAEGIDAWVISSDSPHPSYKWKNLILLPRPRKPNGWLATKLDNQFRHRMGWVHAGQFQWCRRVVAAIKRHRLDRFPMVLSNDIELACYLRRHFPHAFILHQAHNENGARNHFRGAFRGAVNVPCAVSDCAREWNETYYGFASGEMTTVLNGVNREQFYPADPPARGLPVVNFHGRLDPEKGLDVLLNAALHVAQSTNAFVLQLVGRRFHYTDPPRDYDLRNATLIDGLRARGVAVGQAGWVGRQELPAVLQRAHINVVSSRWREPGALALYEGMTCGLATIGSRTGGTPQIVGDYGLLFDNENVAQLAGHLERLITDEKLRQHYSALARERAEQLTWERTWQALKTLIGVRRLQSSCREMKGRARPTFINVAAKS